MKKHIFLFSAFICITTTIKLNAQELAITDTTTTTIDTVVVTFPHATGSVNDFEGLFTKEQIAELEKIIIDYKTETGNEIAVASISSITPYEKFDDYALDLSNFWGVGNSMQNNGLTLMFSKNLRQIRISTGTGVQEVLTDEECKAVIDEVIIPEFKKGDFYAGVKSGVLKLISMWQPGK